MATETKPRPIRMTDDQWDNYRKLLGNTWLINQIAKAVKHGEPKSDKGSRPMKKYSPEVANELGAKLIQDLLDGIEFETPVDAGKSLGTLIMLATRCLDQVMGSEYTAKTLLQVSEEMETGEPQKRTKVEMINRSKTH